MTIGEKNGIILTVTLKRGEVNMKKGIFIYNKNESFKSFEQAWSHDNNAIDKQQEPEGGLSVFVGKFDLGEFDEVKLTATSLGIFEVYVNGNRVGKKENGKTVYDELKPGWTDYNSRVFEFEYDIAPYVKKGENKIVGVVSKGWWSGRISFGVYGYRPTGFCAEVEVRNGKKSEIVISTDETWKTAKGGPVLAGDIYDGEYYDARIIPAYISEEGFEWENAKAVPAPLPETVSPVGPPIREREHLTLSPISATVYEGTLDNGSDFGKINVKRVKVGNGCESQFLKAGECMILDFGQNQVGRPEITVDAECGTRIMGHFAELLNDSGKLDRGNDGPEGSLYVANYRSARAKLNYIACGNGEETYKPLHTFYGYRYFMLTADKDVAITSVKAKVVGSEIEEIGRIETSCKDVNKLISNILWGQRSNYLSVPTDCPQRDERLGWTGDTQIFCGAGAYNANTLEFLRKWMGDMRDSQKMCKGFCDVIPKTLDSGNTGAGSAWGDAGIIVPYKMWLMFGDKSILKENYGAMEIYMQYLEGFGMQGPIPRYGDWLNYDVTPKEYISMAYYFYDASLMKRISELLGKTERKNYYAVLKEQIRGAFLDKYVPDGDFAVKTQTGYLLPLAFDIVEGDLKKKAIKELRLKIVENDYTLSTGFVGTGVLCQTLSECGMDDLAYSLLLQTKDPSWLYSVHQGATTVWERWNSYTLEKGFGDVGMNSFNHYAYGVVLEWMYSYMAGIAPNKKKGGFSKFILRPTPDMRKKLPKGQERITHCKSSYKTANGTIESEWTVFGGKTEYNFAIPEKCEAEVCLPASSDAVLLINGIEFTKETLSAKVIKKRLVFVLPAGKYTVKVK